MFTICYAIWKLKLDFICPILLTITIFLNYAIGVTFYFLKELLQEIYHFLRFIHSIYLRRRYMLFIKCSYIFDITSTVKTYLRMESWNWYTPWRENSNVSPLLFFSHVNWDWLKFSWNSTFTASGKAQGAQQYFV